MRDDSIKNEKMRKEKKKKYYISKHSPILYKQRQRIKISGSRDRALAVFLSAMYKLVGNSKQLYQRRAGKVANARKNGLKT